MTVIFEIKRKQDNFIHKLNYELDVKQMTR